MKKLLIPVCSAMVFSSLAMAAKAPTFSKDVAPILYNRCLECHRPGEAGPMAFRTYQETRPWAKAIKQAVMTHNMPPWYADTTIDHFKNDRHLTEQEVATITQWVDAGAPEGKASELPKLPEYTEGWVIGKPDVVLSIPKEFKIPASGVVQYQYFTIDPGFKEDTWIQAAEVRPTQRAQVHHILVFAQEGGKRQPRGGEQFADMVIGYAPGVPSLTWDDETAFLVKAGSTLLLQVHYTTNGKEAVDKSVVGFKIRKDKPKYRAVSGSATQFRLDIPPGEPNYMAKASYTFREDTTVLDLTPHMHLRGKAFKYVLTYPDGRSEVLLDVPHYDFNWQLAYVLAEPRNVPAGSRMDVTAWYDNSPNNKYNPDPTQTVHWGDQTFNEMMIGFFNYKIPVDRPDPPKAERPTRGAAQ
jgi:hypothetical protein